MKTKDYQPRTYRALCQSAGLVDFSVTIAESDLRISAHQDLSRQVYRALENLRRELEEYIRTDHRFLTALAPIIVNPTAAKIVKEMADASAVFNVGPMAAVAGTIAEYVARGLSIYSDKVIIENGGDLFAISREQISVGIYAGGSPLSLKLALEIEPGLEGISICTSSGTVGHSLSFGNADAVTIIARKGSIADAAATAIGNIVRSEADIEPALGYVRKFKHILGTVIIINNRIGFYGEIVKIIRR